MGTRAIVHLGVYNGEDFFGKPPEGESIHNSNFDRKPIDLKQWRI